MTPTAREAVPTGSREGYSGMDYKVVFVGDDDMPAGHNYVLVRTKGMFIAFIRRSRVTAEVLSSCWRAFASEFSGGGPMVPLVPVPRRALQLA